MMLQILQYKFVFKTLFVQSKFILHYNLNTLTFRKGIYEGLSLDFTYEYTLIKKKDSVEKHF